MLSDGDNTRWRASAEPQIIPPERSRPGGFQRDGFQGQMPGGIFIDLRGGGPGFAGISRFKLALWATLIIAIALALVLTFASLFVIAAAVTACAAVVAIAVGWVKRLLR